MQRYVNVKGEDDHRIRKNRPGLFSDEMQDPKFRASSIDNDRKSKKPKSKGYMKLVAIPYLNTQIYVLPCCECFRWQSGLKFPCLIQIQDDQVKRTVGSQ